MEHVSWATAYAGGATRTSRGDARYDGRRDDTTDGRSSTASVVDSGLPLSQFDDVGSFSRIFPQDGSHSSPILLKHSMPVSQVFRLMEDFMQDLRIDTIE